MKTNTEQTLTSIVLVKTNFPRLKKISSTNTHWDSVDRTNSISFFYDADKKYEINLIKKYTYKTYQDMFDDFDITICQFASDGINIVHGETSVDDFKNRRLVLNEKYTRSLSFRRLMKYIGRGLRISSIEVWKIILT
jgi:hypothetical protein